MQLRLIKTAPMDGRMFLAAYRHKGKPVYRIARRGNGCWTAVPSDSRIEPTHWLPLSELPRPPTKS